MPPLVEDRGLARCVYGGGGRASGNRVITTIVVACMISNFSEIVLRRFFIL